MFARGYSGAFVARGYDRLTGYIAGGDFSTLETITRK